MAVGIYSHYEPMLLVKSQPPMTFQIIENLSFSKYIGFVEYTHHGFQQISNGWSHAQPGNESVTRDQEAR